jgi:hypothetical protein
MFVNACCKTTFCKVEGPFYKKSSLNCAARSRYLTKATFFVPVVTINAVKHEEAIASSE